MSETPAGSGMTTVTPEQAFAALRVLIMDAKVDRNFTTSCETLRAFIEQAAAQKQPQSDTEKVHLAAPSSLKESGPQRDAFEQWYDRQPSGRLNPIDVWTAAIEYAARSGHACEYALDQLFTSKARAEKLLEILEPVATVREMSLGLPWLQWLSDEVALATPAGTLLYAAPSPAPQPLTGKLVPEAFWISFCEFIRDWQGGDFELPELARLDVQACLAALEPRPGIALDGASPVLARTVPLAVAVEAAQAAVQAAIAKGRTHAEIRWGDLNALIAGTSPTPPQEKTK